MAKVVSIEFPNVNNAGRKAFAKMAHAALELMKHNKQPGDHVLVHYDDGSTSQNTLGTTAERGDTVTLNLPDGVET